MLGISRQGYRRYRRWAMSPVMLYREWLIAPIRQVRQESQGAYRSRRVRMELLQGHGIDVSERLIWRLVHDAGNHGLPGAARTKRGRRDSFR